MPKLLEIGVLTLNAILEGESMGIEPNSVWLYPSVRTFRYPLPDGCPESVYGLIAHGLLFERGYEQWDTRSEWRIVEG
jgi:hypothetical protein